MFKFFVAAMLLISSAHAEVLVINPANKASPSTVFAMSYKNAVQADWYQARDCEDAMTAFNSNKDAVLVYSSSVDFGARQKNMNCTIKSASANQVILIGTTHMSICRRTGSGADLGSNRTTMGIASQLASQAHERDFANNGLNVKFVPYGGSQDIIVALRAGDIDLGYVGSGMAKKQGDNLQCLYTTDPAASNYVGRKFKLLVSDFRIEHVILTNSTDSRILGRLRGAVNNKEFTDYLSNTDTATVWNVQAKDLNEVNKFVDNLYKNWKD